MQTRQNQVTHQAAVDELCDRFEVALRAGEQPVIEEWLSAAGAVAPALLPELAVLELHDRLERGENVCAADYLNRFPALRKAPRNAIRLVAVEYEACRRRDPLVCEADFRQRYPELATLPEWNESAALQGQSLESTVPPGNTGATDDGPVIRAQELEAFLRALLSAPARQGDLGQLDKYHILNVLGAGGMGVVLEAWDPDLGRSVAIKVMRPEVARQQNARQRFLREARAAAAVEHPRVVAIHHVGEWRGTPYLVMPRLRGCSLAARLKDPAPLPIDEVIAFIREAAEGLSAAHAKGLIHRDIKPGNIWLEESDQGTHVRLLDFGLARAETGEALTRSGGVVGTAHYMAPEQAAGQPLDARADLFSLGCVLYEMLTRQRAFDGPSLMAVLSALANLQPAPPRAVAASVPEWLSDLTLRLLEKNPAQRPSSADEVAGELRSLQCQQSVTALPGNLFVEPRAAGSGNSGPRARLWLWPAALTLLMLVLALVLLPRWLRDQDRNAPSAAASSGTENGLGPSGKQSQPKPEAPLQVLSVDVRHFAREQGHDVPRGVLGKQSFGATLGDKVQVSVKLSRPAYAYLIAFRPDGVADVCFPEAEDVAPPLTDEPSYPAVRSNRSYGLNEGAGLWVFAVVASEQPLPSWQEWLRERGKAAYAWQALAEAPLGQVWRDNGAGQVETLTSNGILPINRAKDQKLDGPIDAVAELTDSLLHALPQAVVTSVGFPVEPERAASGGTAGGNGF